MFDISEIKTKISKYSLAKPSGFAVNFTPPVSINESFVSDLPFFCDTANIPGMNMQTDQIIYKGFGLEEKRVSRFDYEDFTITLIGDGQGKILSFFQKWMSLIYNSDGDSQTSTFGVPSETVNYPDEYVGTVELYLYNISGQKYHTITMSRAFPSNIGAIQIGWEQQDSLMRIPLTFNFRSQRTTATEQLAITSSQVNTIRDGQNSDLVQRYLANPTSEIIAQRLQV